MKKCLRNIVVILLTLITAGCSHSKAHSDTPQTVVGEILLVGNQPFTQLVLRTAGDSVYILRCGEENEHLLRLHQGKIAEIRYTEIQRTSGRKEINVLGVKILSLSQ